MPAKDPTTYMREYRAARRQPITPRACEHCDTVFTPQRSDARYCSGVCRSAARYTRVKEVWVMVVGRKENMPGCAEPGCTEPSRYYLRRYHIGTGQVENLPSRWCAEHRGHVL